MERTFGRLIEFDERSRDYPIRALLAATAKQRSYTWKCNVWLDQGMTPACTGFSVCQEAAARPVAVANITDLMAVQVYHRAQELDLWPGEDYDGSSVLGAMKAAVERGWYSEYRWAFSEMDLRMAIGFKGPAVLGVNWYTGMLEPWSNGIIQATGIVEGCHAILCNGVNIKKGLYRLHNSWGRSWGKDGECFISFADMEKLLAQQGEACIPVKRLRPKA